MRQMFPALALAACIAGCSQPHCSDRKPEVAPDVRQAFEPPQVMPGATREFRVYRRGSGPPIVIFHELPGLSPATFRLADRISRAGFTVYVPLLFGEAGDFAPTRNFLELCFFNREIDCFNGSSGGRIAAELEPLLLRIDEAHGRKGLGAIGMCLTGALPLELIAMDVPITAAVVAQPAIPFLRGSRLPVPEGTIARLRRDKIPILATRFSEDGRSPRGRIAALDFAPGDAVATFEIDSGEGNRHGFTRASHAVLTSWYCDDEGHPTRNVLEHAIEMFRKTGKE